MTSQNVDVPPLRSGETEGAPSDVQRARLDLAWERINALGGVPRDDFDKGIDYAVGEALKIIEALGGSDPLIRESVLARIIREGVLGEARKSVAYASDPDDGAKWLKHQWYRVSKALVDLCEAEGAPSHSATEGSHI